MEFVNSTSRVWDCYHDQPGDVLSHWVGIQVGRYFIGIYWNTDEPWSWESDR